MVLLKVLDHLEWDTVPIVDVVADIDRARPVWLRIANFMSRSLELLRVLDKPRLVMWKLECWGTDTPFDRVPASPGVDPTAYARELLSMGHRVVPYTFNPWNRVRLRDLVPELRRRDVMLLPIALKPAVAAPGGTAVRRRFGIPEGSLLAGAGGLLHPAKGIDEVVEGFVRTFPDRDAHLLCGLVVEDGEAPEAIRARWARSVGDPAGMSRVRVRVGPYGDWPWMCSFYRSIDLLMVNSVSDSWGRMVSDALGAGVPTLVRRADCGTNRIAAGVVLVDGFGDMASAAFGVAIEEARRRSRGLATHVSRRYSVSAVRGRWLEVLASCTPQARRGELARAAADPASVAALDEAVVF